MKNKEQKRLYDLEYNRINAEKKKEQGKKWREENAEKKKEQNKKYVEENKERKKEYDLKYREDNVEKRKALAKEYYQKNKQKLKEQAKIYRDNNKDKRNEYEKNRKSNDILYKLTCSIRSLIKESIKRKGGNKPTKTENILGCSFEEFKQHLESKFEDWMNWDNYGNPKDGILELNKTWDIDHIIPTSSATTEDELIKLNHYSNLQPLCSFVNRNIKKNNLQ
jgi:hypothetical protein